MCYIQQMVLKLKFPKKRKESMQSYFINHPLVQVYQKVSKWGTTVKKHFVKDER